MYEVKASKIHGKGLFATRNIKKGELIGKLKWKPAKRDGIYVLWTEDGTRPVRVMCDLKYINHQKKANAEYTEALTVVATKGIKVGEEITHDYGDDWE